MSGEGRERRGEPVIVVKKIDVNVTQIWVSRLLGKIGQKSHLSSENQLFLGQKLPPSEGLKRPFLVT